ncbi:unnamed protein product [Spirodela intermedia]|uniref:Exocyst subunit Exo70 family protein n=1 Tax=Spirodela intermedia TaxID=51605 RepID=A0A7I8J1G1_SPIIN|nr:unnamed protein product [Spirodela intermedia]CAA6664056.1 unnamed protein product [Spirodela intermedia]
MTTQEEVEERVLATAQQIVKNLGTSSDMKEDMIFILSNFDNRFSNITDLFSSSGGDRLEVGCSSTLGSGRDFIPWEDLPDVAAEYLAAVDDVIAITEEAEGNQGVGQPLIPLIGPTDPPLWINQRMSLSFASDGGETIEDLVTSEEELDASLEDRSTGGSLSNLLDIDVVRPEAIPHLKSIADRMIRSRYERECCQAYMPCNLGVERMSIEEVQKMEWKDEADITLKRLGDAAKGTLAEFENAVQRETSQKQLQFGGIHPLTRYVMNYVKLLVDYSGTLNGLMNQDGDAGEDPAVEHHDDNSHGGTCPHLGCHVLSTVSYLESNIAEKSKLYEDSGLQYVFLMNNILYMVQKVKDSDLGSLLGDEWIQSYLRASWTKVLNCLKDEGIGFNSSSGSASKVALKERFKNFNFAFEEVCRNQMTWKVPDSQLREELRISISEMVIPAYRSFMGRFGGFLEGGRHAAKYMKYTPEDLERYLLDLFEGLSGPSNHSRRKLSS